MKELILNNNFDDVEYTIENNVLYLDDKSIALLGDSNERTVRRNCKEVLEEYMEHLDFRSNMTKSLYIDKKTGGRPRRLYSHYIAGDVLHRLKSPKAIEFRIWANEKTFRQPAPVRVPMVERLADAMNVDKVEQAERIKELEGQVYSMSKRLGNQRALEKEVVQLKEEVARSNIEIADLYGQLSTMKGNYWKRELEKVQSYVNHSLDEWK